MTDIPRDPLDPAFLASLRSRDARDREGLFLAEGVRFLVRAADARAPVVGIIACNDLLRNPLAQMVLRRLKAAGTPVRSVSAREFKILSRAAEPQGVLLLLRQRWDPLPDPVSQRCATWVAVERVRSPGNLGSILRTCEATGAAGVFFLGPYADPYDPGCLRGAMGALFGLRLVRTSHDRLRGWLHASGLVAVGASPHARRDYRDLDWPRGVMLVIGGERQGLSRAQEALCDERVRIPMVGDVDSLNVAVATGVLLYEALSRRLP